MSALIDRRSVVFGLLTSGCDSGDGITRVQALQSRSIEAFNFCDSAGSLAITELDVREEAYFLRIVAEFERDVLVAPLDCVSLRPPNEPLLAASNYLIADCNVQQGGRLHILRDSDTAFTAEISEWLIENGGVLALPPMLARNAAQGLNLVAARSGAVLVWPDSCETLGQAIILPDVLSVSARTELLTLELWPFVHPAAPNEVFVQVWDLNGRRIASRRPELSGSVEGFEARRGVDDITSSVGVVLGPLGLPHWPDTTGAIYSLENSDGQWAMQTIVEGVPSSVSTLARDGTDILYFDSMDRTVRRARTEDLERGALSQSEKLVSFSEQVGNTLAAADRPLICSIGARAIAFRRDQSTLGVVRF